MCTNRTAQISIFLKSSPLFLVMLVGLSVACGQAKSNFHFEGEVKLQKRKYTKIDIFLYPDTLEIAYPKIDRPALKIAYSDIYSVKIKPNVGKEIIKYTLISSLVGLVIFASLPPDFLFYGGLGAVSFWKSPLVITLNNENEYQLFVFKNHTLKKHIKALCVATRI